MIISKYLLRTKKIKNKQNRPSKLKLSQKKPKKKGKKLIPEKRKIRRRKYGAKSQELR